MLGSNTRERSKLMDCLETMRFLNEGAEVSTYLYDLKAGRVYFADKFDEKYNLPPMTEGSYAIDELMSFLRRREVLASQTIPGDLPREIEQLCFHEYWLMNRDGDAVLMKSDIRVKYDSAGNPCWVVGRLTDAAAGKNIDSLTGLFDTQKLIEDMDSIGNRGHHGYLMVLGIDNFRNINTKHGRGYGNQVIRSVAVHLEEAVPSGCEIYRLDSDKFAVNMPRRDRGEVEALYAEIQKKCSYLCALSAGAVEYTHPRQEDADTVYQQAENALSLAKQQGKNMLQFFRADVFARQLSLLDLQEELRVSVAKGCAGFFLMYQPQIDCRTCRIFGAEALLRFVSPSRGLIRPDEFMPVLEQSGLIGEVGAWVLETALKQVRIWRRRLPELHISVNVSYIQLREKGVAERFLSILQLSGVPGNALTLEVTESMQLQDFQTYNKIFHKLEKSGVQIAIDDFGTGYSSLSYLKRIAIDEIKIDRCFVSRLQHSAYNYRLMGNMIELAHSAQIRVCCEGVETEQEFTALMTLNPDLIQGYLFAKPYEAAEFESRYIDSESEAYTHCRRQEDELRLLSHQGNGADLSIAEQERFSSIVDGMDELVYVRDPDTYELLYLNASGRALTGMYDYKGRQCYKVLMGRDTPCGDCSSCVLSSDVYHVREMQNPYLQRHFLVKEKRIGWKGKIVALSVAIDVTEKEVMTKRVQEKLDFEKNITDCTRMLVEETDIRKAINELLRSIGAFYSAERAYLFELQDNQLYWDNTYEWCAEGITPQIGNLQNVPISVTRRWQELFHRSGSIVIEDIDTIREISPEEWETLEFQGIRNVIVSPVWRNRKLIGFIGVDNPKTHATDCAQVETIAVFLADRLVKDATKDRLNELMSLHHEDILSVTNLGLWVIRLSRDGTRAEMIVDRTMRNILGIREELTPEECYRHWYDRISEGYFHYVNYSVEHMISTGRTVELSYTWNHPVKGEVTVRCLGSRVEDMGDMICLKGYHREINEVDMPKFLPDAKSIIFEYNENRHSIYFHNSRAPLAGAGEKEERFPECWLDAGMVHPHFTARFREIFTDIRSQPELEGEEFLFRTAEGGYEWFKVKTRHLGEHEHNAKTMVVILDPAKQERAMELEFLRQQDFYGATLSEKIAYAEIDMESRRVLAVGGLWTELADEESRNKLSYEEILLRYKELLIHPEDVKAYEAFLNVDTLNELLRQKKTTGKIQMRRLIGGHMRWVELTGHVFMDRVTDNLYALLYMKDIDAAKRRELAREEAATRDPLTHVFNRGAFEEEVIRHMLDREGGNSGTLLLIDMDNFKEINDHFGHAEGDRVLRQMSDILMSIFRRKDLIGRFGGDEFMVFLKNVASRTVIDRRLAELNAALEDVGGHRITCSIGVTVVHADRFSYDTALREADIAMYRSKQRGKNTHCYYGDIPEAESRTLPGKQTWA